MNRSDLDLAKSLLKRRKFTKVITVLESNADTYYDVFDYYLTLGIAYLYLGDAGNAGQYFSRARQIKISDSNLLLGQAVLFLRRGDTDRALQYYIEILDKDPLNQTAKDALEFIRTNGDFETICKWADTGKLEKFYPPLGVNPDQIIKLVCSAIIGVFLAFVLINIANKYIDSSNVVVGPRADLSSIQLNDGSYNLTSDVEEAYKNAMQYFQDNRDNACRVEINKIMLSGADERVKNKAKQLESFLDETNISFTNFPDNYGIDIVSLQPMLYEGCYVSWSGRYSNEAVDPDGNLVCDLLVGYEDMKKVDGVIHVVFNGAPELNREKTLILLGKLYNEHGKLNMKVKSHYQPKENGKK